MVQKGPKELDVYLGSQLIGVADSPGPGRIRFQYEGALAAAEAGKIVLSASLPAQTTRFTNSQSRPFFEGLLPEGVTRETVARSFGIRPTNCFSLLAEIGGECAGAVAIVPSGDLPPDSSSQEIRWLSDADLASAIVDLPHRPLGIGPNGARLSLGGVQQKLLLHCSSEGVFGLPLSGTASTHIVKPTQPQYEDVAVNEAFCLRVAAACGVPVCVASIRQVGEYSCLFVERFDRRSTNGTVQRIHQEDFCQALGILPGEKYEADGGPSLRDSIDLLRSASVRPAANVKTFLDSVILNFLLGNSDAHGKNFALLYSEMGEGRFAPLYDLVSTAVYDVDQRMAMAIGGLDDPNDIAKAAWLAMADEVGVNARLFVLEVERMARVAVKCAHEVRSAAIEEGWYQEIIDRIIEVVELRAASVEA